jgi:Protein of unknown function (DUF3577)
MTATSTQNSVAVAASADNTDGAVKYFDLFTRGIGFVSRIRDVQGKARASRKPGAPSVYCTITVPLDPKGTPAARWTSFDVRVCGADALVYINSLRNDVAAGKKPCIAFSIGDTYADAYISKGGANVGKPSVNFKGRLLKASPAVASLEPIILTTYGVASVTNVQMRDKPGREPIIATLGALHGQVDDADVLFIDSLAMNEESADALMTVASLKNEDPANKVLIGFEVQELFAIPFVYADSNAKAGQAGSNVFGKLTKVKWMRLNGTRIDNVTAPAETPVDDEIPF